MNKTVLGFSLAVAFAMPLAFVSADTLRADTTNKVRLDFSSNAKSDVTLESRADLRAQWNARQKEQEAKRIDMHKRFEAKRAEWNDDRHEKVASILERMVMRMQNAIDRHEAFADAIEARLDILIDADVDVRVAEKHIAAARASLLSAQELLNKIDLAFSFEAIATTDRATDAVKNLRTAFAEVRTHIRDAHRSLVDAVASLKVGWFSRSTVQVDRN